MSLKNINIHFEDIDDLKLTPLKLEKNIVQIIENENFNVGDINLIFCSDDYLLEINKQYLEHNYFTDIITFNYCENDVISGDLFISVERVKENSEQFESGFANEIYRVVFHGILHLIGYNDKTSEEVKLMRKKENYYLQKVDFSDDNKI